MKSVLAAAVLIAAAGLGKADGITGTALCSPGGASTDSSCSGSANDGHGGLTSSSASFSGSISPTSVSISGSAEAYSTSFFLNSAAQESAGGSLTLYTLGPVRPGLLVITESYHGGSGELGSNQSHGSFNITIGDLYEDCTLDAWVWGCSGALGAYPHFGSPFTIGRTLRFTLGEQYVFSASVSGQAAAGIEHYGKFDGGMSLSYYLTDADGNPVDVYAVPEPGSLSLVGMGIAVLMVAALRLRHRYTQVGFGNLA